MSQNIQLLTENIANSSSSNEVATRVVLHGDLEGSLAEELEQVLTSGEIFPGKTVILDFEKVPAVAPDGVRVLINASLASEEGGLIIVNPNEAVLQLLETIGLTSLVR